MNAKKILEDIKDYEKFKPMPEKDFNYYFFQKQLDEVEDLNIEITALDDFIQTIQTSENLDLLMDAFENVDLNLIYKSQKHGIKHNIRVALYAFFLANRLNLTRADIKNLLYACMYHDIGRVNDDEDMSHGARSAKLIDKLDLKISDTDKKILKTIITCHSLPDDRFPVMAEKECLDSYEKCKILFKLLKDSDALDRTRLEYPYIYLSYLRFSESKSLVPLSYLLEFNLRNRLKNLDLTRAQIQAN